MKPLFIPLKKEFFEAFDRGEKNEEYRVHNLRWNAHYCAIGRPVVLSCGYGKKRRLNGYVKSFRIEPNAHKLNGWVKCYGTDKLEAACIGIELNREKAKKHQR